MAHDPSPIWKAALKGAAIGVGVSVGIIAGSTLATWMVVRSFGGELKWGWPTLGVTTVIVLVVPVLAGAAWGVSRIKRD
jgi:hypothetical protein